MREPECGAISWRDLSRFRFGRCNSAGERQFLSACCCDCHTAPRTARLPGDAAFRIGAHAALDLVCVDGFGTTGLLLSIATSPAKRIEASCDRLVRIIDGRIHCL